MMLGKSQAHEAQTAPQPTLGWQAEGGYQPEQHHCSASQQPISLGMMRRRGVFELKPRRSAAQPISIRAAMESTWCSATIFTPLTAPLQTAPYSLLCY